MTQKEYLSNLLEKNRDATIVGSLGTISYDLKEIDHPNKILVKGAMGHAMAIGLGYSLGSDSPVIVVIGDGSFLMKMGTAATVIRYGSNLRVIIIDNEKYESCGGQQTNSRFINFPFETVRPQPEP